MDIKKIVNNVLKEATNTSRNGTYISPLLPGYREFEKHMNGPFTEYVTGWDDPLLDYDSLDGKMSYSKKTIKKREKRAEKIARFIKNNPDSFAWDGDAGVLNGLPSQNTDAKPIKNFDPKKTTVSLDGKTKSIKEWIELDKINLNEDLAVWFGKKKKPKGSKQPKGPWVNICRKVDGKHPPCGRPDTSKGAYPKCRAAGVAGKMSDSEKRSACQQKRRAEKKDTQTGKGQKPVMTSYKKKKTNEDMKKVLRLTESELSRIIKRIINESFLNEDLSNIPDNLKQSPISLRCIGVPTGNNPSGSTKRYFDYLITDYNDAGGIERFFFSKQSENLDTSFGSDNQKSDLRLDVVPIESAALRSIFGLDNSDQFLLKHTYANAPYYCSVNQESNTWKTYFDNLGVATDINV